MVMAHTNQQLLNGHLLWPSTTKGFAASDTKLILVTDAAGITCRNCESATCPISVKLWYYKEAIHDYYYKNKDLTSLLSSFKLTNDLLDTPPPPFDLMTYSGIGKTFWLGGAQLHIE